MTATISSTALLNLLNSYLLDPPDNPALRSDDPQGCSTRFGEGVVLIEAVAHLFQVRFMFARKVNGAECK